MEAHYTPKEKNIFDLAEINPKSKELAKLISDYTLLENQPAKIKFKQVKKLLLALAEIEIVGGQQNLDLSLAILNELKKINKNLISTFTPTDLNELDVLQNKEKTVTFLRDVIRCKPNPELLRDTAHFLYSHKNNKNSKENKEIIGILTAEKYKNDTQLKRLAELLAKPKLASRQTSLFHSFSNIDLTSLTAAIETPKTDLSNFKKCEEIINLCIHILKNPNLKDKELKTAINSTLKNYFMRLIQMLSGSNELKALLKQQNNTYKLADEIAKTLNFEQLASQSKSDQKTSIEKDLSKYQVQCFDGGNANVYLITDPVLKTSVIVRQTEAKTNDIQNTISPSHLRFRTHSILDLSPLTTVYAQIPAGKNAGWIDETVSFEISAAVLDAQGNRIALGDLQKKFFNIHDNVKQNLPTNDETIQNLQYNFVKYAKQILKLLIYLDNVGISYTDLKPTNLLLDKDGNIKVSDVKSIVLKPSKGELHYIVKGDALKITEGFFSDKVEQKDTKKIGYNISLLTLQTFLHTLYQMASNNPPSMKGDTPVYRNDVEQKNLINSFKAISVEILGETMPDSALQKSKLAESTSAIFKGKAGQEIKFFMTLLMDFCKEVDLHPDTDLSAKLSALLTFLNKSPEIKKLEEIQMKKENNLVANSSTTTLSKGKNS